MIEVIVYIIGIVLLMVWSNFKWKIRRFEKLAAKMQGPPAYPIIGIGYQFIGSSTRNENNKFFKKKLMFFLCIFFDILQRS